MIQMDRVRGSQGAAVFVVVAMLSASCASRKVSPYAAPDESARNPQAAIELARKGADAMATDRAKAKSLLEEALAQDLFCGPAHNNLGVLYYKEGKLYEAAHELEWARKLLPGNPDPRLNLALVLEKAGDRNKAMEAAATALEIAPEHVGATQIWTRMALRQGLVNEQIRERLATISLRGESESWRRWAREQLLRFNTTSLFPESRNSK